MSRLIESEEIVRRRKCNSCGHRWYTIQWPEEEIDKSSIIWKNDQIEIK